MVCLKNNGLRKKAAHVFLFYPVAMNYFLEGEIHACADTIVVILNKACGMFKLRQHDLGQSRERSQKFNPKRGQS